MKASSIRNFCIIAHIDHGKSTLADRFLELTGTVEKRKMREQFLDQMDIERERGITIKMAPVRMTYTIDDRPYTLNLIDTPGHADFTYEVSRALAAVEGAILLIDGTQGIQAQTVSNLALAQKEGVVILPAINKVDLSGCRIEETRGEIRKLFGCSDEDIFLVSGKTGAGVRDLLDAVIEKIPPPHDDTDRSKLYNADSSGHHDAIPTPLRALVFDSHFDSYKGVVAHVRVFDGEILKGAKLKTMQAGVEFEALEIGVFLPVLAPGERLAAGEIGYVASGLKTPQHIAVGDTITNYQLSVNSYRSPVTSNQLPVTRLEPLPGYREPKPAVFAGVFPEDTDMYERFRDALRKLKLNDASLSFEPEASTALGRGFRMGFLGMLHLQITGERLRREYGLRLIFSTPSVSYRIALKNGEERIAFSAAKFPEAHEIADIQEPWVNMDVLSGEKYMGAMIKILEETRGTYIHTEHLGHGRVAIMYEVPLREIITDFYDRLKSVTEGYGSMSYEPLGYRSGNLVRLDVLIGGQRHDEFSTIVPRERAYGEGRRIVSSLKGMLPQQLFAVAIQTAVGSDIIARETLSAARKDVTGYLYGGDRTRKMKLWKKQQRGKKRLKETGRVEIPPHVFVRMLMRSSDT